MRARGDLRRVMRQFEWLCLAILLQAGFAHASSDAERALLDGRVQELVQTLGPRGSAAGAEEHLLLCRAFYAEDLFDQAQAECRAATQTSPLSSASFLWLGRVYGAKASRAKPLSAFVLARKVRASFVRAVQLDPADPAAVNDLGRYYVEAPAIVGGGLDQARALASTMALTSPTTQHHLLGLAAQKAGDTTTAERELRAAIAAADAAAAPGAWIDLALYFQQTKQPEKALDAVQSAVRVDRLHSPSLVDAAGLLTTLGQEPDVAIRCLQDYLSGSDLSDAAPAFKVHLQLADLLERRGDRVASEQERATAHGLAPGFGGVESAPVSTAQQVR